MHTFWYPIIHNCLPYLVFPGLLPADHVVRIRSIFFFFNAPQNVHYDEPYGFWVAVHQGNATCVQLKCTVSFSFPGCVREAVAGLSRSEVRYFLEISRRNHAEAENG